MKDKEVQLIRDWLDTGSINIFGIPFAGKDTHGLELAKLFDASFISGGDILRNSDHKHVKKHMLKGDLAPTDVYLELVLPFLSQRQFKNYPLVLSSVGRWHGEEQSVEVATLQSGHPLKAIIYLNISEKEAEARWKLAERGREDDAVHHILLNRFNEFREKTLPVINYYRKKKLLVEVNAEPAIEKVSSEIIDKLAVLARNTSRV